MRITIKRYLVISDLQIPYHHETAVKNVIKLARRERFDSVLCVGDEIDFQTISRWAEKTPLAYQQTLDDDRSATQEILWALTENSKEAHIIRSNHTDRLYNILLKVPGLISLPELQYAKFMDFESMGITFHKQFFEFEKVGYWLTETKRTLVPMLDRQPLIWPKEQVRAWFVVIPID
jgi:hypothetical protein